MLKLIMYPNPATRYLNVDLTMTEMEMVNLNIFNNLGELVHKGTPEMKFAGKNHMRIVLPSSIQAGVYILKVHIGQKTVLTKRFIKGHS